MKRYIAVIAACLGVVVLTGASPIADLISRVSSLEVTVATLETENQELTQQVSTLKAESDKEPVLMDASGVEVGAFLSSEVSPRAERQTIEVAFEVDSLRFILQVRDNDFWTDGSLQFSSNDCSGDTYAWPFDVGETTENAISVPRIVIDSMVYVRVGDEREVPYGSSLGGNGECIDCAVINCGSPPFFFVPVDPVVDLNTLFTPPFRLVTRGDLAQ